MIEGTRMSQLFKAVTDETSAGEATPIKLSKEF